MMIKKIYLRDFRNYREAKIAFSPRSNTIWGENAQGKTNLLEALYICVTGRSFRTQHLKDLIRFGASAFYLEILFDKQGIEQTLKFSFDGKERKIVYNATPLSSLSALLGIIPGVILSPEDRALIKGGPSLRRQFLDLLISQAKPLYLHHLSRYLRAMKQRNVLLKERSFNNIAVWEEHMATTAAILTQMRAQTISELNPLFQSETLGADQLELIYRSPAWASARENCEQLTNYFLNQFAKQRGKECDLGVTLSGPHRDDLLILVHQKEARHFASEGQQKSCTAALKLAQWKWLNAFCEKPPLFCIDDLGVSFDLARENELFQRTKGLRQVFITSARPNNLESHLITIRNGCFIE
jgi:DNA replication and repair protein RecF